MLNSLVKDTYHQVLLEFGKSKQKQAIIYKEDLSEKKFIRKYNIILDNSNLYKNKVRK